MENVYTELYFHFIIAVKGKENLIPSNKREEIEDYIKNIAKTKSVKILSIIAMPDHIHILIDSPDTLSLDDIFKLITENSARYINDNEIFGHNFSWQQKYAAFSHSRNHLDKVSRFILSQESFHKTRTFKDEYIEFLDQNDIEYDKENLLEWIE